MTTILGAVVGVFLFSVAENIFVYLLPFAAGGFIYIAASDLIPEMKKEIKLSKSIFSFIFFLIGVMMMYGVKLIFEG